MEFFFFCIQQYLPGCIALHSSSFEFLKALQMGYQKNMTNTEGSRWVKHDNPADWAIDPHVFAVICFFKKKIFAVMCHAIVFEDYRESII